MGLDFHPPASNFSCNWLWVWIFRGSSLLGLSNAPVWWEALEQITSVENYGSRKIDDNLYRKGRNTWLLLRETLRVVARKPSRLGEAYNTKNSERGSEYHFVSLVRLPTRWPSVSWEPLKCLKRVSIIFFISVNIIGAALRSECVERGPKQRNILSKGTGCWLNLNKAVCIVTDLLWRAEVLSAIAELLQHIHNHTEVN